MRPHERALLCQASTPEVGNPSEEKRRARRHRILNQGRILAGKTTVYCAIRDLSSTGAKLQVGEDSWLPPAFNLMLTQQDIVVVARMQWRDSQYIGVAFDRQLSAAEIETVRKFSPSHFRSR
jgi:hypothetical protein